MGHYSMFLATLRVPKGNFGPPLFLSIINSNKQKIRNINDFVMVQQKVNKTVKCGKFNIKNTY